VPFDFATVSVPGDGQSWPHEHFATVERIVHAHLRAARRWTPKPYDGRAILFAAHQNGAVRDTALGWGPLLPRLSVIEVEADHFSLLREPAVDKIAKASRRARRRTMSQPLASRSLTSPMKSSPDAALAGKLCELIEQWRVERRGRHERIEHFAKIALGEMPAEAPPAAGSGTLLLAGTGIAAVPRSYHSLDGGSRSCVSGHPGRAHKPSRCKDRYYSICPGRRRALSPGKVQP